MTSVRKLAHACLGALLGAALVAACGSGESTTTGFLDSGFDAAADVTTGGEGGHGHGHRDGGSGGDAKTKRDGQADGPAADMGAPGDARVEAGEGGPSCLAPETQCPGGCVNLANDPANCNSCGHQCGAGLVCSSGVCAPSCGPAQTTCGTVDAGVKPDAGDAGPVATDGGDLADGGSNPNVPYCADTNTDRLNCGACGNVCPHGPNSTPVCINGGCSVTCATGFGNCDNNNANGCETNTGSNPMSCGACGAACNILNATASCTNGSCGIGTCNPGFADCDMKPETGCEVDTTTTSNCGGCGKVCSVANATPGCNGTSCTIKTCNQGFADCDMSASDGCEVNTTTDLNNCGGCNAKCTEPNATALCAGGQCKIGSCNAGFQDCDMLPVNGCEIDIETNADNCGGCGNVCVVPNATPACSNGVCAVGACLPGFADCDGNPLNGCEVNTNSDVNNCHGCGVKCNLANATDTCIGGVCEVGVCSTGFANCNNLPADGCEVNTTNNPSDCGGCGHQCFAANGTAGCSSSSCTVASCNFGFADCDGNPADGCETTTTTDPNNCGGCGRVCETLCGGPTDHTSSATCAASTCSITSCTGNFSDFDHICANGCECTDATATGAACAAPEALGSTLIVGEGTTPLTSTMVSSTMSLTDAWFTITFSGNTNTGFHPFVNIASTGNEFVMDIQANCSGAIISNCNTGGDVGSASSVTHWETGYFGVSPAADPNSKNPAGASNFTPIPLPGTGGQVWIHVHRRTGATVTCSPYTITAGE